LTAQLEAAVLRELAATHGAVAWAHFRGKLRSVAFQLVDSREVLGRWCSRTRTIEMSRSLLTGQPWGVVVEVLKHEMAHQWVDEVLGIRDETAHGPAFRSTCQQLGIDPAATGMPRAGADEGSAEAKILERISKLLALAESSNANEAEAAMSAAQRLMLKYNLDQAAARADKRYVFAHLGRPSGRVAEHERVLAAILGDHFFVEVIWVPVWRVLDDTRGSVLEVCGTAENVELASYVHSFLLHAAERLWREHKRAHDIRGDRERRTYLAGVMSGFYDKLKRERTARRAEGLVWIGDADLSGYYKKRHPRVERVRYAGNTRTEAHAHGREAGKKIVLHRGVGGEAKSQGRLLTSGGK
jgi:hypothetical protein